ncbi:MobF family relaxase [Duganella sp. HH105]|uniref:MobF family relaxase n=1 Tax=Duganella sp. HH105 TaxID=1781067 RepID=UPI000877C936|nr:MobF family relaxase [Duganella sp. HH105]OEZ51828.1 multifunctional conjugation protein TraI [Duganella sp. HH105]
MLSLSNVGNGQAGASYYEEADNYYTGDHGPSAWWGAGAASLGLVGAVEPGQFAALLDGRLPSGDSLHHAASGRRGGTDATFSAPKSVSLQALVGGDRRIVEAHRLAVERALSYAETLVACRVTEDGITRSERTGNLVVARFNHDLSRACDPQLHTHCVMINATRRPDGQWRAVDNQAIYRNKMLLGALYRAELARELQALGYGVRVTHLDGRFELAHISERQVRAFSQRSAAIEAYLKTQGMERGEASAWDKKLVAVITRDKKTDVDRAVLRQDWRELSAAKGIDYSVPAAVASLVKADTLAVLMQAVDHASERRSVFSREDIVQTALERGVGAATLGEIETTLDDAVLAGLLIRDGERYTTPAAQQLERDILDIEGRGRALLGPLYQGERAGLAAPLASLSTGQRDAVLGILLTPNQVIGVQGRAGAGKTTLLNIAAEQAKACGYTVKGLAPGASAARELAGAGIDAETITAFSHRQAKKLDGRTLLIVDEAGMASTRQTHLILSEAAAAGCRVVLVGDTGQLQSVEAGKPFAQLQAAGMHTVAVNQIQRQKNRRLKHAVELAVDGQTAMAVNVLDKHITQIANAPERFERIAADYAALPETERAATRVIAGMRYARAEINRAIRSKLGLSGQGDDFILLDRKDHTAQQARSILGYEAGDLVLAETDYPSLGLKRGDIATVAERLERNILLERADGVRVAWQPALATKLTAYVPVQRSLTVGDLVRVTANDRTRGLVNGDMARVDSITQERQTLTLRFDDGRMVSLDGRRPLALDHGYCSTVHASQGQTCDRVLIEADTQSVTSNENTFYVAISRARHHAQIYTDDRDMLPLAMGRQHEHLAALDVPAKRRELENEL